ncbi:MAG TPA: acyltransferase [Puia sp.]|nr:acyltransferase [Puia sp.]
MEPVDGLRAFAVLGVIWAHVWMFFGNLPMKFFGFDLNKLFSFGGIGVDLFFVISGFCMYLMHAKNNHGKFGTENYKNFISKRWKRIAPAFYVAVIFSATIYFFSTKIFPAKSVIFHFLFINIFDGQNFLSPPFWSLSTEWQFYLILPLIFIADKKGKWIFTRVFVLMLVSFLFRVALFQRYNFQPGITVTTYEIWYRFVEFGFGILAAKFYMEKKKLPYFLSGFIGFIISFAIAFAGRIFMYNEFIVKFGKNEFIIRALAEPVLTLGFALMILNLITTASVFKKIISSRPFLFVGKISYSMYLWHWPIAVWMSSAVIGMIGVSALNMELCYLLTVFAVICVAVISYHFFEAPYFSRAGNKNTVAAPAINYANDKVS